MLLSLLALGMPLRAEEVVERARFDWPESGSVEIDVQRFHSHQRVALRRTLTWHRVDDGIRMEFADSELMAIEAGNRVLDPGSELGRSVRVLDAMIPAWEVDADGRFRRWVEEDYEERLRALRTELGASSTSDSTLVAATATLLADPDLQQEARSRGRAFWRAAVEEWLDLRWRAGWVESDSLGVAYLGAPGRGRLTVQVEALPRVRGRALAHVRSALDATVQEARYRRHRSEVIEARLDRATLRPLQVHLRTSTSITPAGGEEEILYEEVLLAFRWPDLPR